MKPFSDFEHFLEFEQDVLREIVREGERRLDVQLATANFADQRALSFLGFIAAGITASVSAAAAISTSQTPRPVLVALAFLFSIALLKPAFLAMSVLRPKKFCFPGNLPENWFTTDWNFEESKGRKLKNALVEECFCLNQAIAKNQVDIESNAKKMQKAFDFFSNTIMSFGALLILYSVWSLLKLGP
jgi:hypothetical protein